MKPTIDFFSNNKHWTYLGSPRDDIERNSCIEDGILSDEKGIESLILKIFDYFSDNLENSNRYNKSRLISIEQNNISKHLILKLTTHWILRQNLEGIEPHSTLVMLM